MFHMFFVIPRINKNVIKENKRKLVQIPVLALLLNIWVYDEWLAGGGCSKKISRLDDFEGDHRRDRKCRAAYVDDFVMEKVLRELSYEGARNPLFILFTWR